MRKIKFVSIPVRDQDRALAFWTEKMGLQIVTDKPMGPGQRWIELKVPGAQTGLALFTPDGTSPESEASPGCHSRVTTLKGSIGNSRPAASSSLKRRRGVPRRSSRMSTRTHSS